MGKVLVVVLEKVFKTKAASLNLSLAHCRSWRCGDVCQTMPRFQQEPSCNYFSSPRDISYLGPVMMPMSLPETCHVYHMLFELVGPLGATKDYIIYI